MPLGMEVDLGPGDIALDGDPYLLWPNGWMDQDATWCCVAVNIQVRPAVNFIKFWY